MSIYGDSIFETTYDLDILYSEIIESSKLFEDFSIINESISDKIESIIKYIINKIKEFLNWITNKIKPYWKKAITKLNSFNLKNKIKKIESKYKKVTESTDNNLDYDNFMKSTDINCYLISDINNIIKLLDRSDIKLEFETTSAGSKRIIDTNNNRSVTYISIISCNTRDFIDSYLANSIKDLTTLFNKLNTIIDNLRKDQNKYKRELKGLSRIIDDEDDTYDIKDMSKNNYDKTLNKIKEIENLIFNYTHAFKDVSICIDNLISNCTTLNDELDKFL